MNITESNHAALLIRALQGDAALDPDDVTEAALALKARIDATLHASPAVSESLILANTVVLQVETNGGPSDPGTTDVVFTPDEDLDLDQKPALASV